MFMEDREPPARGFSFHSLQNEYMYDVIIIGAGPIGLSCGIAASKLNLSYLIIEKGCLVNSIYHYPINMTFFSTSDKIEIGGVPFLSTNAKPTRTEALEYYRRVKTTWDLKVHTYENVESVSRHDESFEIHTSKGQYQARNIVISTGFYDHPNMLGIPGEDLPKVRHYFDDPHPYIEQEILIVGARNSAVDAALETWRKGANVTMVIRQGEIHEKVKYWVRPDIVNRIAEGSIKAYFHSEIRQIRSHEVDLQTPEGLVTIPNDFVLAMTGFQPDYTFMETLGLDFTRDQWKFPVYNEDTLESSVPGIYLAGTVLGGKKTNKWFIENSLDHGDRVAEAIQAKRVEEVVK